MKTTMKTWTGAVLAALLVAACAQPLTIASGGASLIVKAGAAGKRTLMPTLGTYDLTLTSPDHAAITVTGSSTGLFNVTAVPDGTWSVQIEAFVGGNRVASGTAQVSVAPGSNSSVDVPLVFDSSAVTAGGTGGIQLRIVTTASPYPVASARLTLHDPAGAASTSNTLLNQADSSISLSMTNLATGSWVLDVVFFADSQRSQPTARVHDEILVVDGASAYPDLVLSASDFSAPGKVEMVAVAGGTFTYGTAQASLSPYWIGKYDVTQAQFQAVMGFNPSYFDNRDNGSHSNPEAAWSPVESMSLWDAMEYTNRLSLAEGLEPVYTLTSVVKTGNSITSATVGTNLSKNGYRLPTDAEWEFAARAGTTSTYIWGESPDSGGIYSWSLDYSGGRTHGVGQKTPNSLGLYDLFGNVFHFTNDWYAAIPSGPLTDYAGPAAPGAGQFSKITRGSAWNDSHSAGQNTLATRLYAGSALANNTGFRIARNQGPRVPLLNFENLALGDLNGQDGWVVQTYDPGNGGAVVPYSGSTLQVTAFGSGSNQTKMLTLENYMSEITRPLDFPIDLSDPSATYVLSWETQKNAWGTEVGIGADLNGNGRIDSWLNTSEQALAVNLRQLDNGNGAHKAELMLPDGNTLLYQDITAMPDENTPPGWVRVEMAVSQNSVSVRWKNLTTGVWTPLWSGQTFTTSLANTKANPMLWNKLFLLIQADGARVDNISFVKLQQSQTTVEFETNGGSPIAPKVLPLGGRFALPPTPIKSGYSFRGWYRDAALTDPWSADTGSVTSNLVLYAGWTLNFAQRTTGAAGWWNSVAASADATHLAATSDNLFDIWTSSDSGFTWTNRTTATAANGQNWRRVVSSSDGTHLAAAAYGGTLWTSADSGVTWTSRAFVNDWFDIATSADGTRLVASVPYVGVWTSSDSGVNWTQTSLSTLRWAGVASNADGSRLVVGVFGGAAWTSADYGVTWTQQMQLDSAFDSIASSASGQYLAQTGYEKLAVSSDYGVTWTTFNDAAKSFGNVVMSTDGSVMTVVEYVSGDLWTSSDYGATWTNRTTGTAANSIGPPTWTWGGLAASSDGLTVVAGAGNSGPGEIWSGVLP